MRNATGIKIKEFIIHILDPQGMGLVLSTISLPVVQESKTILQYFTRHIQNSLKDPATQAACFRNINEKQPSGFCAGIMCGKLNLVEGSQHLAEALYKILASDARISPADLAVCLFEAENYQDEHFLALLKVDPSQVFRHVILKDEHGNTFVTFEPDPLAFTNERLQKSAFVHRLDPRNPDYDLLLLDRQVREKEEDLAIARFFSERFLDSELAFDPHEHTSRLHKSLLEAHNRVRFKLDPEYDDLLDQSIQTLLQLQRVNLDTWLKELALPGEVKQEIDQVISEKLPDREFDLDPSFSARLVRKEKYAGDYGLRVEFEAENKQQVLQSVKLVKNPVGPPHYEIVIKTEKWERIN